MSFLGSCSLRSCSTVQARCGTAAAIFPRCLRRTEPARLSSASARPWGVARAPPGARGGGAAARRGAAGLGPGREGRRGGAWTASVESGRERADAVIAADDAGGLSLPSALGWNRCEATIGGGAIYQPLPTFVYYRRAARPLKPVYKLPQENSIQAASHILSSSSLKTHT